MPDEGLIPIAVYAARVGRDPATIRQRCLRGAMPGAVKLGRDWLVPADAPLPDRRVTSGRYRAAREGDAHG